MVKKMVSWHVSSRIMKRIWFYSGAVSLTGPHASGLSGLWCLKAAVNVCLMTHLNKWCFKMTHTELIWFRVCILAGCFKQVHQHLEMQTRQSSFGFVVKPRRSSCSSALERFFISILIKSAVACCCWCCCRCLSCVLQHLKYVCDFESSALACWLNASLL